MPKKKTDEAPKYYVLEQNIPIPPRDYNIKRDAAYIPYKEMRVGESFLVPPTEDIQNLKRRLFAFINKKREEGVEIKYAERRLADGSKRFWRIK